MPCSPALLGKPRDQEADIARPGFEGESDHPWTGSGLFLSADGLQCTQALQSHGVDFWTPIFQSLSSYDPTPDKKVRAGLDPGAAGHFAGRIRLEMLQRHSVTAMHFHLLSGFSTEPFAQQPFLKLKPFLKALLNAENGGFPRLQPFTQFLKRHSRYGGGGRDRDVRNN
jgi:hypothetical protein